MARDDGAWTWLATRMPKALRFALKLHCVKAGVSAQDFVTQAVREKLTQESPQRVSYRWRGIPRRKLQRRQLAVT